MSPLQRLARARPFRALHHAGYRLYIGAFLSNQLGFWIANIALQGVMVDLTDNDPLQLGLLFFALFSPALLFAPLAGVVADVFDRRLVMLLCYAVVALVSSVLALACARDALGPLTVLLFAFLMGVTFSFAGPAAAAVAANVVRVEELGSAVSLQSTVSNLTRVVGPMLAAPLIATHHFAFAFVLFAAASAVAGLLVSRIQLPEVVRELVVEGTWARVRGGFAHARERHPALYALLTASVLSLFGVAHTAIIPPFAEAILHQRDSFAWIFAATGVGATFGAVTTGFLRRPVIGFGTGGLFLYGGALIGFGLSRSIAAAVVMEAVVGFFYFAVMTSLQTLLQEIVDDAKRGRVMSLFQVAWGGLFPLGALSMGAVARYVGIANAIVLAGTVCSVVGATLFVALGSDGKRGVATSA